MGSHWSLLVSPSNGSNSVGSEHVSVSVNLSSLVLRETLSNVWINLAVRMDFMAGTHVFGRYFFSLLLACSNSFTALEASHRGRSSTWFPVDSSKTSADLLLCLRSHFCGFGTLLLLN